jgi:hypothetical protein
VWRDTTARSTAGRSLTASAYLCLLTAVLARSPPQAFTSAAPYDPTFWPLHGVAERFLSYKRIAAVAGKTTINETWGYRHDAIASDTHHICDWSNVTGLELPTCTKGTCPGHHEDDVLPMGNFLGKSETCVAPPPLLRAPAFVLIVVACSPPRAPSGGIATPHTRGAGNKRANLTRVWFHSRQVHELRIL